MSRILIPGVVGQRHRGGGFVYDPDAANYIGRVEAKDGAALEDGVKLAMNQLFLDMKAAAAPLGGTNWTSATQGTFLLHAGPRTLAGCLEPLYPNATLPTMTNFVSGDYNRKTGLLGANGKWIDYRDATGEILLDDQSAGSWIGTIGTAGTNRNILSSGSGAGFTNLLKSATATNFTIRCSSISAVTNNMVSEALLGFVGLSRTAVGSFIYRLNGTNTNAPVSSTVHAPEQCRIFARSDNGQPYTGRLKCSFFMRSIDLAAMDTALANYFTAINAAIP